MHTLPRFPFLLILSLLLTVNAPDTGGVFGQLSAQQPSVAPVLASSTFFGGNGSDEIDGIAVDAAGNIYLAGTTSSTDLPVTPNAFQRTTPGGFRDCFVAKLNPSATAILYLTYLGGGDTDIASAIAVDSSGNAYVVGTTLSRDFPVTPGAAQIRFGGADVFGDAFVVKLDSTGSTLIYGTYLGGSRDDLANTIALDSAGAAYLAGSTRSRDFPVTSGAFQPTYGGDPGNISGSGGDGFAAKLSPTGDRFEFVTYLGGASEDFASSIALDSSGNIVIAGTTSSPDFPSTPGVVQPHYADTSSDPSTSGDAFVTKLSPHGDSMILSTFLGGSALDAASSVQLDSAGNLYLQGFTKSSDFPVFHALQASPGGQGDVFAAKLNPAATALIYSTYFGGNDLDTASGTIDRQGNVYLSGYTNSTNLPAINGFQPYLGNTDTYVAKIDSTGGALVYSSYLGGGDADFGGVLARDSNGNIWLAGSTFSPNFPTRNAIQSQWNGGDTDAFLARIAESAAPPPESSADLSVSVTSDQNALGNGSVVHFAVTVANQGPAEAENVGVTLSLPTPLTFKSASPGQGTCTNGVNVSCSLGVLSLNQTVVITFTATVPSKTGQLGGTLIVTSGVRSSTSDPNVANNSAQVSLTISTPGNVGGGSGGSGCFIATAAYGSYLDPHVQVLRTFRDQRLLTNALGRAFVRAYYRHSPAIAALIAQSAFARRAVRCMLAPLFFSMKYPSSTLFLILICAVAFMVRRHARIRTCRSVERLP